MQAGGQSVWQEGGHCRLPSRSLSSPPPAVESWFLVRVATWKQACIPPPSSRQERPSDRDAQQDASRHPGRDLSGGSWKCRESTSSPLPLHGVHTVMWSSPSPRLQGDATGEGGRGLAVVIVQSLSCVQLFATPWAAARQASLSFTISWSLLKLMSIESVMPPNHLILCCPPSSFALNLPLNLFQ